MKLLTGATGTAEIANGVRVLKARLDLSRVNSGHDLLGIRLPGIDWNYYPMVVR
ncbi:MAG: hypothetical protein ACRD2B_01175 [Terriglobia bacterium]